MNYNTLLETKEPSYRAVEQLHKHSYLTPSNFTALQTYKKELSDIILTLEGAIELGHVTDFDKVNTELTQYKQELEWLNQNAQIYRNTRINLLQLSFTVKNALGHSSNGYGGNPFFDFLTLVKQINAFYGIDNPNKAPNKVAYGWNFCIEKGSPRDGYKGSKLYLWGCIKNYLIQNGIEFDKNTSLEVRKIVRLTDCWEGDD